MKITIYLILFSFITSCASSEGIVTIKYKRKNEDESKLRNYTYYMELPNGFKTLTLVGGHDELEKQYIYSDSSKIYISDFGSSGLNYSNIRSLGDSIAKKRFEGTELKAKIAKQLGKKYKPETLILQGKMANGLYWKDIRIGYLSIGYVNVSENKKSEFDKVLSSFVEN
jgi:hypothetical protein